MKYQWLIFRTALMFFTRIPVGVNLPYSTSHLQASARYFSWVGILVGIVGGAVLLFANQLFSPALSIAFSMLATILLTGSFHEDGLADCCDAFGGGWTAEKILTIMKDSRLGTYGVVGLISALSFKFLLLLELFNYFPVTTVAMVLIAGHSSSRFFSTTIMQQLPYVQDIDSSKSKPLADRRLTKTELLVSVTGAVLPLLLLYSGDYLNPTILKFTNTLMNPTVYFLLVALIPPVIALFFAARFFKKWIGGYTGDCLGATQQICEIAFYIGCLLLWKFI
ncbi:MAG: adenosylcobinamide-GDP ribazoletransferase [Sediminibacterium sp.]|nr:adenosylcobinamide-GDP ribazoletransferase [Sediminibacterium sp.]